MRAWFRRSLRLLPSDATLRPRRHAVIVPDRVQRDGAGGPRQRAEPGGVVRNATSVSTCATVTALPPARAGIALGRRDTNVTTNATVATRSRSSTPRISYHSSRPLDRHDAERGEHEQLVGHGIEDGTPMDELPKRRAICPSSRSLAAAAPSNPRRDPFETNGNAMASGMRTALRRSAVVHRARPCSPLRRGLGSDGMACKIPI